MTRLPRLLIAGGGGFLGGYLVAAGKTRFECLIAGRSAKGLRLDITDAGEVRRALQQTRPDAVALAAAISDIDECQRHPARAHATNVEGAAHVARECARVGARLLFTSTGAVFDGEADDYAEESALNPLSVYGQTKAEAERIVAAECPGAIVVRISLALGAGLSAGTNSWLDKLRAAFDAGQTVTVADNEYRNAIDAETAARWMLDLAAAPGARGIFHLGSSDAPSRFEIARRLAAAWGYPERFVAASRGGIPGRAPRGRRHMLRPARIARFSEVPVPTSFEAIERCVHAIA